ncbi:hypothetical protein Aduo_008350 [Ancylostoma duodenale]
MLSLQNLPLLHLVNAAAQANPRLSFPMLVPPNTVPRWSNGAATPVMPTTPNLLFQQVYGSPLPPPPRLHAPPPVNCE